MKPPPRIQFELLDFNLEIIMNLSPSAEIFCETWVNYLHANGWDEESYEYESTRRILTSGN